MIKTNLIVSIAEDAVAGDQDAITIKTTTMGNIIVEMPCPKIAVKIQDLKEALSAIEEFISARPLTVEIATAEDLQPTFEFQYPEELDKII